MKIKLLTVILISFIILPALKAGSSELEQLQTENEAEIKKVVEVYENNLKIIDKAYLKRLVALMKYCMKKGDLDGAVAVREEINIFREKLGVSGKDDDTDEDSTPDDSDNTNKNTTDKNTEDKTEDKTEKPDPGNGDDKVFGEEEF